MAKIESSTKVASSENSMSDWSLSGVFVILLIAAMTLGTELSPAFKSLLVSLMWHHWIAKGIISLVAFVVLGFTFSKMHVAEKAEKDDAWWLGAVLVSTLLSGLIIFSFYVWHYFS